MQAAAGAPCPCHASCPGAALGDAGLACTWAVEVQKQGLLGQGWRLIRWW